ncbi:efflux transporter outer membrane subunit [Altericroceibacterium endophyticum]|uniref:Efflux transporter outer membrane subunit n=1 Tax=Altericroceibacterium endophyticum TaxID=1808508 RepID=A0A6I4TB15_9SPHN|nr:efflux transporter outer membrane subunit [Altericroceibacterium endophyticum]MXO66935.1 efflux transporter outer membrane subunit [Altericroceibacterium endophyticum]
MIRRSALPLLTITISLAGCAAVSPTADTVPQLTAPEEFSGNLPPSGLDDYWWKGFADPVLDQLILQGLESNLEIDAAQDRLRAAAALLRAEKADRLPSLDGSAQVDIATGSGPSDSATAGLFGEFDPDLSGRLSAEVELAAAEYAESEYLLADRRRIVAAAIASQYIEYRRTGAQLALLDESTSLQEQTLRIVTLRYQAGLAANLDVRRAASDLARTRAGRGLIEISRSEALNALAVLLGREPGIFDPGSAEDQAAEQEVAEDSGLHAIPAYSTGPALGGPTDLLRRRGDVIAAEMRLAQSAAQIGIERSDLMPSLTFPAQLVIGDGSVSGLFSDMVARLGAALNLPLFDGGRRRAEITAAEAQAQASLAEYQRTFLMALGEVENSLVAIGAYSDRGDALEEAIMESESALAQSDALYREGLASLFDVLDAQRQLISSRQSLLDNRASLASAHIALHLAAASPE